jgi:CRISPR system Cascade subunit CasE
VVYQLFEDVRTAEQKKQSVSSGFLYADKGGDFFGRKILLLSNRDPQKPKEGYGQLSDCLEIKESFLAHKNYRFEVVINPTHCAPPKKSESGKIIEKGKILPIKRSKDAPKEDTENTRQKIAKWFCAKAPQWGFSVDEKYLEVREVEVKRFNKGEYPVTLSQAKVFGYLTVTDREQFIKSFQQGIGRGRAFGCGLLQIVPVQ